MQTMFDAQLDQKILDSIYCRVEGQGERAIYFVKKMQQKLFYDLEGLYYCLQKNPKIFRPSDGPLVG